MRQAQAVTYAVRLPVIGKCLAQLAGLLAVLTTVPLLVSLLVGEWTFSLRLAGAVGVLGLAALGQRWLKRPSRLQANESLVIAALAFVMGAAVMTYPLMAGGVGWLDALFEAVSAVTTTGLSTAGPAENMPATHLFTRAWMQWYGGLGIVVFTLALVTRGGLAARQLGQVKLAPTDIISSAKSYARAVLIVYLILTAVVLGACWLAGLSFFDAAVHALTSVSTGGFSTQSDSLASRSPIAAWVVMAGCFAGALSLTLYHRAIFQGWRALAADRQLWMLLAACAMMAAVLSLHLALMERWPWPEALHDGALMAVSAQTTAGFSSTSPEHLSPVGKLATVGAMTVGGGLGSTAGGIKLLRLLIFFRVLQTMLHRAWLPPHAVLTARVRGQLLEDEEVRHALLLIVCYAGILGFSWLAFLAWDYEPLNALFDVASAMGTVGLSTGVTGPQLPAPLKGVLMLNMLLGRLEIFALLVLIHPRTWFGHRTRLI